MTNTNSSERLQKFVFMIDSLNPISLKYNEDLLFNQDDDTDRVWKGITKWNEIVEHNPIVYSINIDITQYHHSIISIVGEEL